MKSEDIILELIEPWAEALFNEEYFELHVNKPLVIECVDYKNKINTYRNNRLTNVYWQRFCQILANKEQIIFDSNTNYRIATDLFNQFRFEGLLGKHVKSGVSITIRRINTTKYQLVDYEASESLRNYLTNAINDQKNIVISGGTATGKTVFLQTLLTLIPENKKLIILEDQLELMISGFNNISRYITGTNLKQSEYSIYIDHVLRSNAAYIVLGEITIHNAFSMVRLLNVGQAGFFATIHANNPQLVIEGSITQNLMLAGYDIRGIQSVLAKTIDVIIQLKAIDNRKVIESVWLPKENCYWHESCF